jgi:transposase
MLRAGAFHLKQPTHKMNETTIIHIGIDVSKEHLDCDLHGKPLRLPNSNAGASTLLRKLMAIRPEQAVQINLEATGCYTRVLVRACLGASVPIALINPRHIRSYARAAGQLAKTDEIDARVITAYARHFSPPCLDGKWLERDRLAQYHRRLDVLIQTRASRKTSMDHYSDASLRAEIRREIAALDKRIATITEAIDSIIGNDPVLLEKRRRMEKTTGIGPATSRTLAVTFPELGTLNRQQAAALAGLAPMNRDSGAGRGKRCIQAGRAKPRKALYMAALTAAYRNPMFSAHFRQLRERGKPVKVALTAIARKLLIHLNTELKSCHQIT